MELAAGQLLADDGPVLIVDVRVPGPHPPCSRDDPRPCALELLGAIYDGDGKPLRRFEERKAIEAATGSVSISPRSPIAAGPHVVRVAVRSGERIANAATTIDVPDLTAGGLALSDLFVAGSGQDSKPAPDGRAFAQGGGLEFVLFAYNLQAPGEVSFEIRLLQGEKAVVETLPFVVPVAANDASAKRVPFSRRLDLTALDRGEHTLVVKASDRAADASAERRLRFRVE
jgi:hypothetical protein